jgi:phosphatidylinositol alpha-1,6-mannosyltransferase
MERLIYHVYDQLTADWTVGLVGPRGCEAHTDSQNNVRTCALYPLPRFLACAQVKALWMARTFRPSIVIAGSGITAPAALLAGRAAGAVVICYLHGLDLVVRNWVYQSVFVRAVRSCDILLVNSKNTMHLAIQRGVDRSKLRVLYPGVSLPLFQESTSSVRFKNTYGIPENAKLLLSVGRLTERKGLLPFIDQVLAKLVKRDQLVHLVVIGDDPAHSLASSAGMRMRIEKLVALRGLERQVTMLGNVDDDVLQNAYLASSLHVFPVQENVGDVEGFGMVAIEAAAHGLPTVAFSAGGVPDAVHDKVSGYLVPAGDYGKFHDLIVDYLKTGKTEDWQHRCRLHAQQFTWERFGAELRTIVDDAVASHTSS